jgi:hypothetical protein
MKLLTGLIFLAALNTTLVAGLMLLLSLPMRPLDWLLMVWPWGLVGAMVVIRKWQPIGSHDTLTLSESRAYTGIYSL